MKNLSPIKTTIHSALNALFAQISLQLVVSFNPHSSIYELYEVQRTLRVSLFTWDLIPRNSWWSGLQNKRGGDVEDISNKRPGSNKHIINYYNN